MIAITSDIDWAPEEVLKYMIKILEKNKIRCTFFCTHFSNVMKSLSPEKYEISVHPNFNKKLDGNDNRTVTEIIDEIKNIYPESVGIRNHSLLNSTQITNEIGKLGFEYISNESRLYEEEIHVRYSWNNLKILPIFWEDDFHWLYGKKFDDLKFNLTAKDLKIFNFHPIHIYLNTPDHDFYQNVKKHYQNPKKLWKLRNKEKPGVCDFFENLCSDINHNNLKTLLMREI